MNKFIMLRSLKWNANKNSWDESDYYLINVSQIIWIHPTINENIVELKFEDGSLLHVKNSKEEILEMMILKPWWKDLINFFRWIFIKKEKPNVHDKTKNNR